MLNVNDSFGNLTTTLLDDLTVFGRSHHAVIEPRQSFLGGQRSTFKHFVRNVHLLFQVASHNNPLLQLIRDLCSGEERRAPESTIFETSRLVGRLLKNQVPECLGLHHCQVDLLDFARVLRVDMVSHASLVLEVLFFGHFEFLNILPHHFFNSLG